MLVCQRRQVFINQLAKLTARCIKMQNHKRVRVSVCHLPHILISRNLQQFSILVIIGLVLQFMHSFLHILTSKLVFHVFIIKIDTEFVLKLVKFTLYINTVYYIWYRVLLCVLLLLLHLNFSQSSLFL